MNEPVDLAYVNYGHSDKVWEWMQERNKEHMLANPICEICRDRPSVRITPVGTLKASCLECIADIRKMLADDLARSLAEED